ncbi:STAS domain-containing protein [Spongiactinospora sp. TRM90649]|uniref:STAS domain-containing protein n=1 Tax=Spongiactinospora sp. TRM90649 TaxID=3031114 RepID=UPI0023F8AC97|nr:STAS domain-containing protein [Spongiactinospora sp. TRM90649]MDF5755761.1 STAS domain-containing protein [Spongiactinospora sp. TRM90649]
MTISTDAGRRRIGDLLGSGEEQILQRWRHISEAPADELREMYAALRAAMSPAHGDFSDVQGLLAEFSRSRARLELTPSETSRAVFALKEAVYETVEADGDSDALRGFIWFSKLIDDLGLFTFETYSAAREKIIRDQAEQLLELSTPVVKLWEGIVAVPLIGTLDSARTQVVMEKLLQKLVETGAEHAVIDITGVPAVDTEVAQHLLKTVAAARLMGAECSISGISPQIAHTIVTLGIEFGDIVTKATLADALAHALWRSGVQIRDERSTRFRFKAETT